MKKFGGFIFLLYICSTKIKNIYYDRLYRIKEW